MSDLPKHGDTQLRIGENMNGTGTVVSLMEWWEESAYGPLNKWVQVDSWVPHIDPEPTVRVAHAMLDRIAELEAENAELRRRAEGPPIHRRLSMPNPWGL